MGIIGTNRFLLHDTCVCVLFALPRVCRRVIFADLCARENVCVVWFYAYLPDFTKVLFGMCSQGKFAGSVVGKCVVDEVLHHVCQIWSCGSWLVCILVVFFGTFLWTITWVISWLCDGNHRYQPIPAAWHVCLCAFCSATCL